MTFGRLGVTFSQPVEKIFFIVILSKALHRPEPARFGAPHGVQGEAKNMTRGVILNEMKDLYPFLRHAQDKLRRLGLLKMTPSGGFPTDR